MCYKPLVSIVTPSYNQGQFIKETIRSVLDQDYPNIEYIIIDGGSLDGSVNIIQKYEQYLAYWISEPDRGQAHAINKGLALTRGEILGWLNADDVLLPTAVSRVVTAFTKKWDVDVVYGNLERIDENSRIIPTPKLPKDKVEFNKTLVIGECVVNQPGSFWRRSLLEKVGLLNEKLHYGLDYDYWIRSALAGAKFKRLPDTLARFRISKSSKTVNQTAEMGLEQIKIIDHYLLINNLPEQIGLTNKQMVSRGRKTKSKINLHIFYGYLKRRNYHFALRHFVESIKLYPFVLFDQRWLDLAFARFLRSNTIKKKR